MTQSYAEQTSDAALLAAADGWRMPMPEQPCSMRFKEWQHFNICLEPGLELIINFSVFYPIVPVSQGGLNVIALAHETGWGWTGCVQRHEFKAVSAKRGSVDVAFPGAALSWDGNAYLLSLATMDDDIRGHIELVPKCRPFTVQNIPIGAGKINWLVVANLTVTGEILVGGRKYDLAGARGYHDHNWGSWLWGERFGWDWGYCPDLCQFDEQPVSLVYDRTTDRSGSRVFEHFLGIWIGSRLDVLFTREMIVVSKSGHFDGEVRRSPPVMGLLRHDRVRSVPAVISVSAKDGDNWIEFEFQTDAIRRVEIPKETRFGAVSLDEMLGWMSVRGQVRGRPIEGRKRTCFECLA